MPLSEYRDYLCVTCEDCHHEIALREFEPNLQHQDPQNFKARCLHPSCGSSSRYDLEECHQYRLPRMKDFEVHQDFKSGKVVP